MPTVWLDGQDAVGLAPVMERNDWTDVTDLIGGEYSHARLTRPAAGDVGYLLHPSSRSGPSLLVRRRSPVPSRLMT